MFISFMAFEETKLRDYILLGAATIFLVLGKVAGEFPLFVFLGLAPLFALCNNQQKKSSSYLSLLIKLLIVFLVGFFFWTLTYSPTTFFGWLLPLFYSMGALLCFVAFWYTDKHVKSRVRFLTFILYWMAFEYIMFMLHPEFSRYFLASAFNEHARLISWNVYTGFMGVSLWILVVNVFFYYAIFKDNAVFKGNIRWGKMAYTLVVICVPFLFNVDIEGITRENLLNGLAAMEKQIAGNGEYIGRTAVWVSILLLLYSFVKQEVTKNE